ncbi:Major allergen I polypeptide chain 1 [Sciurus carolinensis]|uniref:Major allergen I polypeptide chain 1 n=1 Tax=Sciurus carolinensis TaxID=30640 RepID=A0AA41T224_SCICA|nr:Major allergen I polypeptide chain 1 [Sciurus carolinensis]
MKPASALVLLGTALLLIWDANCNICPAVQEDVDLFMKGNSEKYVAYVAKYQSNPLVLENAKTLKKCVDEKLTEEDKDLVLQGLVSLLKEPVPLLIPCSGRGGDTRPLPHQELSSPSSLGI